MLGPVDHVGYLVRDLQAAVADFRARLGVEVQRRFERPQFALEGVYLGAGTGDIEIFTFTDAELARSRLDGAELRLDHVAYRVSDIQSLAGSLRAQGVRFSGPDLRGELSEAVDLGGMLHLWTIPDSCLGLSIQLMQAL
jgi:catechol 2,3-dioxygenase-like lactoylglutathione lyase family enzyme